MPRIAVLTNPDRDVHAVILNGLRDFNQTLFPLSAPSRDIAVAVYDDDGDGTIVGGLWGRISGNWLAIELIFVPEALRGAGLATRLIASAEAAALDSGCGHVWLDTLNEKALGLYLKLGYEPFGTLEDYAEGKERTFLRKRLPSV